MQHLQKVYYKSDLKIRIMFRNWQTEPLPRFVFLYSTENGGGEPVKVSYDGKDYVNCVPCDEGVMVCLDYPHFMPGRLKVERYFPAPDERFPDDEYSFGKEYLTGIEIIDVNDFNFIPGEEVTEQVEIIRGEKGEKGDKGDKGEKGDKGSSGSGGMNYSLLTEQEVPGEFWLGTDGVSAKQVYCRTFAGNTASSFYESGYETYPYMQTIKFANGTSNISVVNAWIRIPHYTPGPGINGPDYEWDVRPSDEGLELLFKKSPGGLANKRYQITVKYTKY